LLTGASAQAQPKPATVAFANSGASPAQAPFLRGVALLHNFEYGPAAAAFREAQAADPGFALAYWGEAMTYNHPVWMEQDADKARAVLARLGATAEARAAKAPTPREKAYLAAVETLYGPGDKADRDLRYSGAMAALHDRFPDDVDATAFYALSLLGTAHAGRDFATYMRAAALLEEVFPTHPDHPGVLHYLIHSYDDPVHAPLGMRAARRYGIVAPYAGHALHMTSHIFVAMGLWDDVVRANVDAMRTVNTQRAAAGQPAMACHHYSEWQFYAYLQQGRRNQAADILAACRREGEAEAARIAAAPLEPRRSALFSFSDMQVRARIDAPGLAGEDLALPSGAFLPTRFAFLYGRALAAWPGDGATLRARAAEIAALMPSLRASLASPPDYSAGLLSRFEAMYAQVQALDRLAGGDREGGLAALRKAAADEHAMPMEFGPPAVPKPGWELLGDELMRQGRAEEAAAAYRAALARAPGRTASLSGLAAANRALDDSPR
jgi:tetratricopeptide (TPR) repeat protein